jgi:hypothetical protein
MRIADLNADIVELASELALGTKSPDEIAANWYSQQQPK